LNNAPPLVHPDLLASLGAVGYFPSLCAIQLVVETQDAAGQPIEVGVGIPGKEAMPCRVAHAPSGDNEVRRDANTVETVTHDVCLQGHYPEIVPKNRVVVGLDTYDILAVKNDSTERRTVLRCQELIV